MDYDGDLYHKNYLLLSLLLLKTVKRIDIYPKQEDHLEEKQNNIVILFSVLIQLTTQEFTEDTKISP